MTISPPTTEAAGERGRALAAVPARAAGVLTVDLGAIAENYGRLKAAFRQRALAAVVKADGYGLGAERVAPALVKAGARSLRSEEHTSELQSLLRISYAVLCLNTKMTNNKQTAE